MYFIANGRPALLDAAKCQHICVELGIKEPVGNHNARLPAAATSMAHVV